MQREKKNKGRTSLSVFNQRFSLSGISLYRRFNKNTGTCGTKIWESPARLREGFSPQQPPVFVGRLFLRPAALQSAGK